VNSPAWYRQPFFHWSLAIFASVSLGVVAFELLDISVFKRIGMAHEYCYLREPKLIWLHVISDVLIGAAYVSISGTLGYLVYRASKGIPFHWVFLAFGLFIVSCGLTHFMEVWVIWEPVYWMSGYVKVITAAASVATAVALFPLVPKVFALIDAARRGEQRRVEIEQLNQELERFNYSVAHDLRSPLRGIAGFSHLLREDLGEQMPEDARRHLDRIEASVARMDTLINDLLRYSTIGRQQLELGPVAVREAAVKAMELLDAQIREANGEIILEEPLPKVIGDLSLLQVVLQNLIGNSLKFVAPGVQPRVVISATVKDRVATVLVTDNGIGIADSAREKIFRMFERFDTRYPGTGIGLAIVHRAVERMQGRIGVSVERRSSGAQFWLELPLA
jgi:signal transduction histidine kinase